MAVSETMRPHWMHRARSKDRLNLSELPFIHYVPSEATSDRVVRMTETELGALRVETHERGAEDLFADNVRLFADKVRLKAELEAALADRDAHEQNSRWFMRERNEARKEYATAMETLEASRAIRRGMEAKARRDVAKLDELTDHLSASRSMARTATSQLARERRELERVRRELDRTKSALFMADVRTVAAAFERASKSALPTAGPSLRHERDEALTKLNRLERTIRSIGYHPNGRPNQTARGAEARLALREARLPLGRAMTQGRFGVTDTYA